jgi:plastocyanin
MKKLLALVAAAAILVVAVPAFAATRTVRVDDNVFSPKRLTVNKGDKLRFRWVGDAPHNVRGAGINIGIRRSGTRTVRVRRSGTLVCTIHPGMEMRLRVRRR